MAIHKRKEARAKVQAMEKFLENAGEQRNILVKVRREAIGTCNIQRILQPLLFFLHRKA